MDTAITRHDNSPPLADRLALDHEALAASAREAAALVPDAIRPVTDDEEAGAYADTAKAIKAVAAKVEAARKVEKDEVLKTGRTIDGFFAKLADPLKAKIDAVVQALNVFQRAKLEAERRAQAEADRIAQEEAQRAAREAALFDEPAPAPAPVSAPVVVREAARVVSDTGTKATASRKWVFEVTDREAVPRHFMQVNEAALKAAIAGGAREIAGVRIYETVVTAIR